MILPVHAVSRRTFSYTAVALALLFAARLAWVGPGISWDGMAGLLLLGIALPGSLFTAWLLWRVFPGWLEFSLYALGLGYVGYILWMYGISALPGPLTRTLILLTVTGLNVALAWAWWRVSLTPRQPLAWPRDVARWHRWLSLGLFSVLAVGWVLRLPNLGYAEFLYDETRVMLRASELIQGYSSALMIHSKGPAETLIVAGFYVVQNAINESTARLPFALINLVGLAVFFLLGWRMFGAVAGWAAAMLLAVDGYLISFARFAQYQSVVFALSGLVVLALYRQARSDKPLPAYLMIAALCFTGAFYAHYEALWVVLPGCYLLGYYGWRTGDWRGLGRALLLPLAVTIGLCALFYVPFILDARWQLTAENIVQNRIGLDFPYNNLRDVFWRTSLYSSAYLVFLLIGLTVAAQVVALRRGGPRWAWWSVAALTLIGLGITFAVRPDWIRLNGHDHTWTFFAWMVAAVLLLPRLKLEDRTVWLWFGVPMVLSLFFVVKPNTHVYGFFLGWALVAATAVEAGWQALRTRVTLATARWIALPLALVVAVFVNYGYQLFGRTDVEVRRTWDVNRPVGYWAPFDLPTFTANYGFPQQNGWKVVGALYANGALDAPFDSDGTGAVDWYSRGPYFCPPDADYYMLPIWFRADQIPEYEETIVELGEVGYYEWGVVTVQGDPRLRIFSRHPVEGAPHIYRAEAQTDYFDRQLSTPSFAKVGPALVAQPETVTHYEAAHKLALHGYAATPDHLQQNAHLNLHLFWQPTHPISTDYHVRVQVTDPQSGQVLVARDRGPACERFPMPEWRVGEVMLDPYSLQIAPDARPGEYALTVEVYDPATGQALPWADGAGMPLDDSVLELTSVEVAIH